MTTSPLRLSRRSRPALRPAASRRDARAWPRRAAWALAALLAVGFAGLVGFVGCAKEPPAELLSIRDDQHRIENPGVLGALATGRACAATKPEARSAAERVARFNLRSLTGAARYVVHYEVLQQGEGEGGYCMELSARAAAARPYER